ncbi:MAG: nuclear transport factor 2 family protein [Bryobacterales bacterium]|nr:nuclear transport factor 2 family protein [Bryobacterales bacterium]
MKFPWRGRRTRWRQLRAALLFTAFILPIPALAQSDELEVLRTVQRAYDAMAAHDGVVLYEIFLPEATIAGVTPEGRREVIRGDEFIRRSVSSQEKIRERIWDAAVIVNAGVATLVAPYDFHRNGKFSHCGVDAVTLLKTSTGWRINHIFFTMVREGCPASPFGKLEP